MPTKINSWLSILWFVCSQKCCFRASTRSVESDIGFCFSNKCVAKIYPHSSVSLRSVLIDGGIIDSDFRGNVTVVLHNFSTNRVEFITSHRITQVLFQRKESSSLVEVENFDNFIRDKIKKGFGSTEIWNVIVWK